MNSRMIALALTIAVAAVVTVGLSTARADDAKAPASPAALLTALAEAGKPGPEHKKLEPLVGNWNFTLKMWTDPSQPPAELKGTIERKWVLGGRFVQESVNGQCATTGKTFEGLGLVGYHPGEKKFTLTHACGLCGTASTSLATCDASGRKFTCTTEECCPLSGQKVSGRDEIVIESNDKVVTNIYKTIDGKEAKVMECVAIRQK